MQALCIQFLKNDGAQERFPPMNPSGNNAIRRVHYISHPSFIRWKDNSYEDQSNKSEIVFPYYYQMI